jgi:hypothetical protein
MRLFAFVLVVLWGVTATAEAAISDAVKTSLQNAATVDQDLVDAVKNNATAETIVELAGFAGGIASDTAMPLLSEQLTAAFPEQSTAIVTALVQAKPALVAEIVLAALANTQEDARQAQLELYLAALRRDIPGIENQPAFAAISIPGISGVALPDVGLTRAQRRSDN